jgi:hypothetical protein
MLDPSSFPVLDRRASNHLGRAIRPRPAFEGSARGRACTRNVSAGAVPKPRASTSWTRIGAARQSGLRNSTAPGLSRRDVTGTVRNGKLARTDP